MLGPLSETIIEEWLHEGGCDMKGLSGVGRHGGRWKEDQVRAFHPSGALLSTLL